MESPPATPAWKPDDPCPCGGERFARCCAPILDDTQPATTAQALMRSRYSAFVLGDVAHLRRSWDPQLCPAEIHIDPDRRWLGLRIKACEAGLADQERGVVEFVARYKVRGKAQRVHERSRFRKASGRWLYVDGDLFT